MELTPLRARLARAALVSAYLLSGAAALVYEVLWVRLLTLRFGQTTLATSAVLAAFMGGLALGAAIAERIARRLTPGQAIRLYALLEALIALTAALAHLGVTWVPRLPVFLPQETAPFFLRALAPFTASFLVLVVPTILMGMTLPLITSWASADAGGRDSEATGVFYGANTLGAMAGTALCGFLLIPALGLNRSLAVAAALNLASAALALTAPARRTARRAEPEAPSGDARLPRALPFLLFMTGAAAMICQAAWTRAFAQIIGSSTYAFTIMLFTFLGGFSAGSLSFARIRRIVVPGPLGLGVLLGLSALALIAYLPFFNYLPYLFARLFPLTAGSEGAQNILRLGLCAIVMAGPTFLMGLVFPWALAVVEGATGLHTAPVGRLYAVNTAGAVAGSALAGLVLLPMLGAETSLLVAAGLYTTGAAAGVMLSDLRRPAKIATAWGLAAILLPLALARPRWDPYLMTSGIFLYAGEFRGVKDFTEFRQANQKSRLIFHKDGLSCTVSVFETPWGARYLRVNGKTDASTESDMMTQLLQGHLPALLHPGAPKRALVIGLGSGVTAAAMATHPAMERVDCVEIEPAVAEAMPFFERVNGAAHKNPKIHLIFTDGRRHLETPGETYDLISSEPSNPWIAGIANLFTKEAFSLARERLAPGGVFCQWFHSYSISEADFRMVLRTFSEVFPNAMLFTTGERDFFLVGSREPWELRYDKMLHRFQDNPAMTTDLRMFGLGHPYTLLAATFLIDGAEMRAFTSSSTIHADAHPTLEFSAPLAMHHNEDKRIYADLMGAKTRLLPEAMQGFAPSPAEEATLQNLLGETFMRMHNAEAAETAFGKALAAAPRDPRTWTNMGRLHNAKGEHLLAEQAFKKAISLEPTHALAWFHLGMLYLGQGLQDRALSHLQQGLRLAPGDPMGTIQVAQIHLQRGEPQKAAELLREALKYPALEPTLFLNMTQLLKRIESGLPHTQTSAGK